MKKEELKAKLMEVAKKKSPFNVSELCNFARVSRSAFYTHRLHNDADIAEVLADNRTKKKSSMLRKWAASENATLQIAAFKLLAEPEELLRLVGGTVEQSHGSDEIKIKIIDPGGKLTN